VRFKADMKRLLIIDDEGEFLAVTRDLLESKGFAVDVASNGLTGIKMARQNPPDLILCDLLMEPLDGFMTLSVMRQHVETAPIPFVIVSGSRELESVRRSMLLGADDYLTKPFTPDELVSAISPILDQHRWAMSAAGQLVRDLAEALELGPDSCARENLAAIRFLADEMLTLVRPNAQITMRGHRRQLDRAVGRLSRHMSDTRLLDLIDQIAADPRAMAAVRGAGTVEVADVIAAGIARRTSRGGRLTVKQRLEAGRVAMITPLLNRIVDELFSFADGHGPADGMVNLEGQLLDPGYVVSFACRTSARVETTSNVHLGHSGWEANLPSIFRADGGLRLVSALTGLHGGAVTVRLEWPDLAVIQMHLPG
jgi:two-component system sensor histidine kinase/response regulator